MYAAVHNLGSAGESVAFAALQLGRQALRRYFVQGHVRQQRQPGSSGQHQLAELGVGALVEDADFDGRVAVLDLEFQGVARAAQGRQRRS